MQSQSGLAQMSWNYGLIGMQCDVDSTAMLQRNRRTAQRLYTARPDQYSLPKYILSRPIYFGTMLSIFSSISNKSQLVLWGSSLGGHTYIIRMKSQSSRQSPRPLVSPTTLSEAVVNSHHHRNDQQTNESLYCTNPRIKSPTFNNWH